MILSPGGLMASSKYQIRKTSRPNDKNTSSENSFTKSNKLFKTMKKQDYFSNTDNKRNLLANYTGII